MAITDNATSLVEIAQRHNFRKTFINRGDIGGRYSVLSNFGLLPMALMGIDIEAMPASAKQMKVSCDAEIPAANNPAVSLGAVLGIAQICGRDKITFVMSPSIKAFGYWVEQLVAESTRKERKGLIPIIDEAFGLPAAYGDDRIFVHIFLSSDDNQENEKNWQSLKRWAFQ